MDWFRWHHGTVNDPKWRVVSRRSGANIRDVLAVFAVFLERASQAERRGSIEGWEADDIAAGLDMEPVQVTAIHAAMQGKVLDGDLLTGWEKRQPVREREDHSTARVQKHREAKRRQQGVAAAETPGNASQRQETPGNAEKREEQNRQEGTEDGASAPSDLKSVIFCDGLDWLARQSGRSRNSLRSLLGRCCALHGDAAVIAVLSAAQREGPVDPIAWMERAFLARAGPPRRAQTSSITAAGARLHSRLSGDHSHEH